MVYNRKMKFADNKPYAVINGLHFISKHFNIYNWGSK